MPSVGGWCRSCRRVDVPCREADDMPDDEGDRDRDRQRDRERDTEQDRDRDRDRDEASLCRARVAVAAGFPEERSSHTDHPSAAASFALSESSLRRLGVPPPKSTFSSERQPLCCLSRLSVHSALICVGRHTWERRTSWVRLRLSGVIGWSRLLSYATTQRPPRPLGGRHFWDEGRFSCRTS